MIDDYLYNEYLKLSEDEKYALMVYKSKLGYLINDLDNNPDFESYYEGVKEVLNNPANIFVKMTVYKNIDMTSIETFKSSIEKIKDTVESILTMITLNEDLTVYRLVSADEEINDLAKGNIISTSLSFAETISFLGDKENIAIFQINLHKGDPVMYVPYSLLTHSKDNRMTLSNRQNQDEIILDKRAYDFEKVGSSLIENKYQFIEYDAKVKTKQR